MKSVFHRLRGLAAFALLGYACHAHGQYSWNITGSGNWATAANWTGASGSPNATNATATLGSIITADSTVTVTGPARKVGQLNIASPFNYTVTGGTLRFDVSTGSAEINISDSGSPTIASSIILDDNLVVNHNGSGAFTMSGGINLNSQDITFQGSGASTVSGVISGNANSDLIKSGTGTLTLTANNTYSGTTTVNNGILAITNGDALGDTTNGTTVSSGGTLALSGGIATAAAETLSLSGSGYLGGGALLNQSGDNTFTGNISFAAGTTITSTSGLLTLGNSGGNRTITNNGHTVTFDGAGNTLVNAQFIGTGGLIKNGTGTLTLSYGNNADTSLSVYSGTTTVNRGLLITDLGATDQTPLTPLTGTITIGGAGFTAEMETRWYDQIGNSTTVNVLNQGTLTISNATHNTAGLVETIGALNVSGGSLVRTINGGTNPATLQLNGNVTHDGAGSTSAQITGNLSLGTATRTFTINNSTAAIDLDVSATVSGTGGLTKTGAGHMRLSGTNANTFSGATTVSGGTLELAKSAGTNAIASSSIQINSGATLLLGAANQIPDTTNMTLNGGTFSTGATTGFAETLGTLTLSANSTINLGTGVHLLNFANSSALAWSGILTINGWTGTILTPGTQGRIFFGTTSSGLTLAQLAQIQFAGFGMGAAILSNGEIVPIPEPGVILAASLLALAVAWRERKHLTALLARPAGSS